MTPTSRTVLVALSALIVAVASCGRAKLEAASAWPSPRTTMVETKPLPIDQIYHSMTGPFDKFDIDTSDMDWITKVHTEVIDQSDGQDLGGEFFCHSQLSVPGGMRLAVNATGGELIDLPPGFGLPVSSFLGHLPPGKGKVNFFGMVLNNNFEDMDKQVRIRATIDYLRDEDLDPELPLRPLYYKDLTIWVDDICEYVPPADGPQTNEDVATHCVLVGDKNVHWMVPPGKQVTRRILKNVVPVDSRLHFVAAHVHNFGRYVKLTDRTTGELVWQSDVDYLPGRPQIASIGSYSSAEGLPIYAGHEYELEALYDNTTDADVDAMAVMYLYFSPMNGELLQLGQRPGGRRRR